MSERTAKGSRDQSLDFLRGLAALNIILIHTVFWSGENYVPQRVQTLSLLLDVPFFFFLSGWAADYVRSLKKTLLSLVNIYLKYLVFFCMYILLLLLLRAVRGWEAGLSASNLLGNLVFQVETGTMLPVVMGSIWFMPVYFTVVPVGGLILWLVRRISGGDERKVSLWTAGALGVTFLLLSLTWTGVQIPLLSQTNLFHLFFYLLGFLCRRASIPRFAWMAGLGIADAALLILVGRRLELPFLIMQDMKFPPNVIYFLYSLPAVIGALWLREKLSGISGKNPICWAGRSALLFYFCQGIGSSLLLFAAPRVALAWYWKLPLMYAVNLLVTAVCVWLLSGLYRAVFQLIPEKVRALRERI